ncbi:cell wall hydrolase [Erythrobacter sp. 3-20A1M]|nr:cell wall hydrolase [Erythrobacter sp. 3-20A1M]
MGQKKLKFGTAAIIATGVVGFFGAEATGAFAQEGVLQTETLSLDTAQEPALVDETMPVMVSEPVVQPLPEPVATPEADEDSASSLRELVSDMDTPKRLSREMECLAGAIYFESRGEPLEGQLAVARVIVNRAESRVFPSDYCGVVYQRSQFSFVRGGRMPSIRRASGAWQRARKIARIAHEDLWDSKARDSLYFHAKRVRPSWSNRKIARATISSHVFYR